MKNAMKKLMSLVLVAMILVSAVPFQAAAAAGDPIAVIVYQKQSDGSELKAEASYDTQGAERVAIADICAAFGIKDFAGAWYRADANATEYKKGLGDTVPAGGILKIRRTAEPVATEPPVTEPPVTEPPVTEPPVTEPAAPVVEPIKIVVKNGTSDNVIWSGEKVPANGEYALVKNILSYCFNSDWSNVYTFGHAWSTKLQSYVVLNDVVYAGDTLSIMLKEKTVEAPTEPSKPSEGLTDYTKFHEDVWLYIYADTTVGTVKKSIKITDGIAADGKVTLNEVKSLVRYYYNAVDADLGITFDGLYPVQGNWVADYAADKKYDTIDGLYEAAANQTVIIRVMIGNAKLASSSSSNADSTNPKTGDNIFMAVSFMAVSASALAAAFFFNKKRAI